MGEHMELGACVSVAVDEEVVVVVVVVGGGEVEVGDRLVVIVVDVTT
jgi:hypothetical protein